jgi:hypothetical protein
MCTSSVKLELEGAYRQAPAQLPPAQRRNPPHTRARARAAGAGGRRGAGPPNRQLPNPMLWIQAQARTMPAAVMAV